MAENLIEICCHGLKIVLGHFGNCCNGIPDVTGRKKKEKNVFESSMERRLEFKM